jgi:threonine/homoserine/homoserine lactone efflux protein
MDLAFFIKGFFLGFSMAAPVGPIGILCIRKTLQYGRFSGLFSGLGAATADTLYGLIATFSLSLLSTFLMEQQFLLRLVGGAFLCFLGGKTFLSNPQEGTPGRVSHKTLIADFVSTFFLTLSNPITLFSFIAFFAGLGLVNVSEKYTDATILVTGIFMGSSLWWLILSEGITFFRSRISTATMAWINRIAGLVIVAFGMATLISLLHL